MITEACAGNPLLCTLYVVTYALVALFVFGMIRFVLRNRSKKTAHTQSLPWGTGVESTAPVLVPAPTQAQSDVVLVALDAVPLPVEQDTGPFAGQEVHEQPDVVEPRLTRVMVEVGVGEALDKGDVAQTEHGVQNADVAQSGHEVQVVAAARTGDGTRVPKRSKKPETPRESKPAAPTKAKKTEKLAKSKTGGGSRHTPKQPPA